MCKKQSIQTVREQFLTVNNFSETIALINNRLTHVGSIDTKPHTKTHEQWMEYGLQRRYLYYTLIYRKQQHVQNRLVKHYTAPFGLRLQKVLSQDVLCSNCILFVQDQNAFQFVIRNISFQEKELALLCQAIVFSISDFLAKTQALLNLRALCFNISYFMRECPCFAIRKSKTSKILLKKGLSMHQSVMQKRIYFCFCVGMYMYAY